MLLKGWRSTAKRSPPTATALCRFFFSDAAIEGAARRLFEAGLVNRRRLPGDEWVDRSLANRVEFTSYFQAVITRIAWHENWSLPGLDETTRRLLVIAITATPGRWEESALHVRSGLEKGEFSKGELKEVLLQIAIYSGVPAANSAFTEEARVIENRGKS